MLNSISCWAPLIRGGCSTRQDVQTERCQKKNGNEVTNMARYVVVLRSGWDFQAEAQPLATIVISRT